jgi:hypothetical protein
MGCSRQYLSRLENMARPSRPAIQRYLAGLAAAEAAAAEAEQ